MSVFGGVEKCWMMDEVTQESTVEDDPSHSSEKTPSIFGISRFLDCNVDPKRSQISKKLANSFNKKAYIYMKLPHQKSTVFWRFSSEKKKKKNITNTQADWIITWSPIRGDGEKRSGITSWGSLILKMWSKHKPWNLVFSKFSLNAKICSFYPQKTTYRKPQTQAFGIQLFTFQWRIACFFNHQVLSHEGANPIQTLPLVPSTIVTGPKALIAFHFIPHSCKRNDSSSTAIFFGG